ncbi:MAG TPA: hypothetical protein VN703_00470 [Candidatus Sulfopaludibacter sp.]|nr:hypothetical protein [Candidatus Sulfopaludibacter sp.]
MNKFRVTDTIRTRRKDTTSIPIYNDNSGEDIVIQDNLAIYRIFCLHNFWPYTEDCFVNKKWKITLEIEEINE